MKRFLKLLFAHCEEFAHLSSEALDRDLSRAERWAVNIHTAYCSACRRYRRHLARLRTIMERLSAEPERLVGGTEAGTAGDAAKLSPQARERILRKLTGR